MNTWIKIKNSLTKAFDFLTTGYFVSRSYFVYSILTVMAVIMAGIAADVFTALSDVGKNTQAYSVQVLHTIITIVVILYLAHYSLIFGRAIYKNIVRKKEENKRRQEKIKTISNSLEPLSTEKPKRDVNVATEPIPMQANIPNLIEYTNDINYNLDDSKPGTSKSDNGIFPYVVRNRPDRDTDHKS